MLYTTSLFYGIKKSFYKSLFERNKKQDEKLATSNLSSSLSYLKDVIYIKIF